MSPPTIDYDALAAQHGGIPAAQIDYDALAAQHGGVAASLDLSNKQGQGTYQMKDSSGQSVPVPYGQVQQAARLGYGFADDANRFRYAKDNAADPNRTTTFTPAAGDPRASIAYQQQMEKSAPLPIQVAGGVSKGAGTLARPALDIAALGAGANPQQINQMLTPQGPVETAAKYGTIGAALAPAAIAAPVATAGGLIGGTVGGAVGNAAGNAMRLTPQQTQVLADVGGAVGGGIGSIGAPAAVQGIGRLALKGETPAGAMESALKLPLTMPSAQREQLAQTALKEEIPISQSGLEKMYDAIDRLDAAKWGVINKNPNVPIDPNAVAQYTNRSRNFFSNQAIAEPDVNAIEAQKQQWLRERGAQPATPPQPTGVLDAQGNPIMGPGTPAQPAQPITAVQAQTMKQNTGTILRKKFGEMGAASTEAQKDLVFGLKEEIANQFPELKNLNQNESRLLDLQPYLEKAVNRQSNNQVVGIGAPIFAAGLKAGGVPNKAAIVLGVMKGVLDNPMVKSRLAIAVSKGGQVPYATALGRVTAYSAALGSAAAASESPGGTQNQPPNQ